MQKINQVLKLLMENSNQQFQRKLNKNDIFNIREREGEGEKIEHFIMYVR